MEPDPVAGFIGRRSLQLELLHRQPCYLGAEKGFAAADHHRADARPQLGHGLDGVDRFLTLRRHKDQGNSKDAIELVHNIQGVRHAYGVEHGRLDRVQGDVGMTSRLKRVASDEIQASG